MKKTLTLLLTLAMLFTLAACGSSAAPSKGEKEEIIVFAAASMTETLNQVKDVYEKENNVTITYNFDSSGTLKTQIQEGADCDLFISAGQKQMNQLDLSSDKEINKEGLDFVAGDTRLNLLENKVVLVVPEGNPKGIESFDDLAARLAEGSILMAMGNSDVPVGQYTQKILNFYGLDEEALAKSGVITYGSNVKEVTTQVSEGSVDCGIVYCTDAFSAGLTVIDGASKDMCGQVIYPAAVLKTAKNPDAAKAFLDYLTGSEAMAIFEAFGFSPFAKSLIRIMGSYFICAAKPRYIIMNIDWYPLINSLRIAAISCVIVFFTGVFFAYYAARLPRTVKGILDVILTLPMVLPPTVCGYFLLLIFGTKRPIGIFLMQLGIKFVMTWYGGILAAAVVAFPLMYRTARGAFESFDCTLSQSGQTLGLSNTYIFWRIRMPACRQGILAGTVLAFARALGEYGATSMLIGYTPGKTATISTTVYQLWRTNDDAGAFFWVMINLAISTVVLLTVNLLESKQKVRAKG